MNELRFYKPTKSQTGAASKIELRVKTKKKEDKSWQEVMLFWVAAQQGPDVGDNASFYWKAEDKRQVNIKIGEIDAGELLAVLNNRKEFIGQSERGLYHQNANGSSSFTFKKADQGYYLRLASQDKDKKLVEVKHSLTWAEGELLRVMLTEFVKRSIF